MTHANRRTHERKSLQAEAWIQMPPGDNWSKLSTVDMSTGGFAFISREQVAVNSTRQFRLQLPQDGGVMHVEGRIMHSVGLSDTSGFRVGVQALKVDLIDIVSMETAPHIAKPDSKLDLSFTRLIDVPKEDVWAAWTQPELLKKWFTPAPWKTVDCEIDLRPGGIFRTVMQGPDGQQFPGDGCYLDIVPNEKLVWTNALLPGFRPAAPPAESDPSMAFKFTVMIQLESEGKGTKYTATVFHSDEAGRSKHEAMGFFDGWNTALDQLVALVKN